MAMQPTRYEHEIEELRERVQELEREVARLKAEKKCIECGKPTGDNRYDLCEACDI